MKNHGIRGNQLFTLDAVDHENRHLGEIDVTQVLEDLAESLDSTAVVVFLIADDELLR